ncbi:MAG: hypothetical protein ACOC0U_07395, partial [Desulfovibrionales bacterium]
TSVRESIQEITHIHEDCSREATSRLQDNVHSLQQFIGRSEESTVAVSERMREIAESTGEIVAALQFQDITRQQVEHVSQALDDVASMVEEKLQSGMDDPETLEIAAWVADVCRLQDKQTESGRIRLVNAVENILENIRKVAENVERISEEMTVSLGMEEDSGRSTLTQVGTSIAAVAHCMEDFAARGSSIGKTMQKFVALVENMSSFVTEIEEVGAEIELISLNASVKAAQAGSEGAALGVLAVSIQGLSLQARKHTMEISSILNVMSGTAERLQKASDKLMDITPIQAVLRRQKEAMGSLHDVNDKLFQRTQEMSAQGKRLSAEIRRQADSIRFHKELDRELSLSGQGIERKSKALKEYLPKGNIRIESESLREIFDRYTMDAERIIHGSTDGEDHMDGQDQTWSDESEFGENIELF